MKNKSFAIFVSVLILFASAVIQAQETTKSQSSVRFKDGVTVIFTSETAPPDSTRQPIGSLQIRGENNVIQRVLIDEARGVYFGYDLLIEPVGETGRFKLSFQPLSAQPGNIVQPKPPRRPQSSGSAGTLTPPDDSGRRTVKLSPLALAKYPDAQIVRDGDTIAFNILVNSKTGVKIVDLIKVVISGAALPAGDQTGGAFGGSIRPAKDFSAEEVEFKVASSKLITDGTAVSDASGESRIGVIGALIWFYVPQRGRFILSLTPREGYGFQKTGTIQGNKIKFSMNGNQYEWVSNSPIVSGQNDNWNLYVLHESGYIPNFAGAKPDSYLFGAADRIENLIRKK